MSDPTRPLPSPIPLPDGGWRVNSTATPTAFTIRGLALLPPDSTIPIIVVPGIMGTNLTAKIKPRLGRIPNESNQMVGRGEAVWRPPNTQVGGLWDSFTWDDLSPGDRQRLFDPNTLEVDDGGPVNIPLDGAGYVLTENEVRQRWWGEVHADSYAGLLYALQTRLNHSFWVGGIDKKRHIKQHWKDVMACDPEKWGVRQIEPLTEAELEKHARHHYPVYACGYNWLESCEKSSQRLEKRILEIIESWRSLKRQCEQVILVTHSMGGLVARACAKRIPDKIAGVIHGVMPALGAPAAYRRIACGTETSSPSNGMGGDVAASRLAKILGETTDETTPVLATSPGALELLPNHLYPRPWLHLRVMQPPDSTGTRETAFDYLHLPNEQRPNPYKLYRDMTSWYRIINPALADPAEKYRGRGDVIEAIKSAIDTAERFHMALGDYYHPNTYAFYGDDQTKLSFGRVRWVARRPIGSGAVLTGANVAEAQFVGHTKNGGRHVSVEGKTELLFEPEPQDIGGDGTVPRQSGAGPAGKIRQLFETRGYGHQGSYNNDDMLMLTLRLIAKIAQGMP